MNTPKETCLRALEQYRGDDLERAKAAFAGLSEKELQLPYGASGRTRAELLADYENKVAEVKRAMEWINK